LMDSIFWITLASFTVASVFSAIGLGGGLIYMPLLLLLGVKFHQAATLSLAIIMASMLSAAVVYLRAKKVNWPMLLILEPPSILGAFIAGRFSCHIPTRILGILLALTMLAVALWTWHKSEREQEVEGPARPKLDATRVLSAIALGFAAGILSASVGIGGGIVKVPVMLFILGAPIKVAIATSVAMMVLTCSSGFLGHITACDIEIEYAAIPAVAAMLGAQLGSRFTLKTTAPKLRKAFALILVVLTPFVILRTW